MSRKTRSVKNYLKPNQVRFEMSSRLKDIDPNANKLSNKELFDLFMSHFGSRMKPIYIRDCKTILGIRSKYQKGGSFEKLSV